MGTEYFLVKPNKEEIFYLGKHMSCPYGVVNRTYHDNAQYIDYDCWDDFLWDFLRENADTFDDVTLSTAKEIIYAIYQWCLDDKVYFDNDCREGIEWANWKETGSLITLFEKFNNGDY